jgi:hypothetical protein
MFVNFFKIDSWQIKSKVGCFYDTFIFASAIDNLFGICLFCRLHGTHTAQLQHHPQQQAKTIHRTQSPPAIQPRRQQSNSPQPSKPARALKPRVIPDDMIGLQAMFPNEPLSVLQAALNSVKGDYVKVVDLLEVRYVSFAVAGRL